MLVDRRVKNIRRSFRDDTSGQAILEIALFTPILMFFLFIAIDFGRLSQYQMLITTAARAGVQYGSQSTIAANDIPGMTAASLADVPATSGITVTDAHTYCTCADGSAASCTGTQCTANHRLVFVSVTTRGKFNPLFSYFGAFGDNIHLHTAVMQVGL